jgi:hypothetical protein
VASALAVVHSHFSDLVDVCVVRGMAEDNEDMATTLLMPQLEGAIDAIPSIAPLDAVLRGPSPDRKG